MKKIYLDYNASSPIDPRVLKKMMQNLEEIGNPSSSHFYGQQCRRQLEESRQVIAQFFRVKTHEVIFTSNGTEGAALLLQGILFQHPTAHVISSRTEHACVYETLKNFEKKGGAVSFLQTGTWGAVNPQDVEKAITPETRLITLMAANNETGVLTDIQAVAAIAQRARIPFVVDGVAWLGKEIVEIPAGVTAIFFSGHKIYAPKGIGFCICRQNVKLTPLFVGGGQEYNRRSGTENLAGIVALAEAITLLKQEQLSQIASMRQLRDHFEKQLMARLPQVIINGLGPRISNTANLAFMGIDGETLLMHLDMEGLAVSHGSACASGALEPSRILLEMGIPLSQVRSSIRFSIGRMTTTQEIEKSIEIIERVVKRLQSLKHS